MNKEFKKDDYVVCIDSKLALDITKGKIYQIIKVQAKEVRIIDDRRKSTAYYQKRFEKISVKSLVIIKMKEWLILK